MNSAFVDMEDEYVNEPSTSSQTEGLLDGEEPKKEGWAKYEGYFDVDTEDVIQNIKSVLVPKPGLRLHTLDLYGPFWIATTLVFSASLGADLRYDFDAISIASGFIFPYALLTPLALYGILLWKQLPIQKNIAELISIYGYALAPFIPISFLLIIPIPYLQTTVIFLGSLWSSAVLGLLLWDSLPPPFKQIFIALHFILMFIFLFFFTKSTYPDPSVDLHPGASVAPAIVPASGLNATHSA
ncbi:protein YIPF1 [Lepeophtheirus salmonis]|uniref:Protein YIPF n=1 Tax=Lepeophtheirus salmonis TaxID=72036 RepID=A0A0K2V7L6_LEPSM|nr:protein YIPF1-like [Lepeophtheirus salmonis]